MSLETYKAKCAERDHLVAILAVWGEVKKQGIDPDTVSRFAIRSEFMTPAERRHFRDGAYSRPSDKTGVVHPTHANCLILKDETVVQLSPWVSLP